MKPRALRHLLCALVLTVPGGVSAHPMGNFSISHYAAIRIEPDAVRLRYLVDLAEIPTFQALQESPLPLEPQHPAVRAYLARTVETLGNALILELDGRRLALRGESSDLIFPPGAGGLPTLKIGAVYRASLPPAEPSTAPVLTYRDTNYPGRAGWKEIVASAAPGVTLVESTAPERDRSGELSDYPTDPAESPPQALEAQVVFTRVAASSSVARLGPAPANPSDGPSPPARMGSSTTRERVSGTASAVPMTRGTMRQASPESLDGIAGERLSGQTAGSARADRLSGQTAGSARADRLSGQTAGPTRADRLSGQPAGPARADRLSGQPAGPARADDTAAPAFPEALDLAANSRSTPRDAFTALIAGPSLGPSMVLFALAVAVSLGAFHALEPGHGKTVVAAYLVGSRGTAGHALLLGLVVTASHTVGVYLLGVVTLYASRHVVPERLYPWLGAASGLLIAVLGVSLLWRRLAGPTTAGHGHAHDHAHGPHTHPSSQHEEAHAPGLAHGHDAPHAEAHAHGLAFGHDAAHAEVHARGLAPSHDAPLAEAHARGLAPGHDAAHAEVHARGLAPSHDAPHAEAHARGLAPGHDAPHAEAHAHGLAFGHDAAHAEAHARRLAPSHDAEHAQAHVRGLAPSHDAEHAQAHVRGLAPSHDAAHAEAHDRRLAPSHAHGHHHHHIPDGPVSLRALVALGVSGGIVPCPAALVVLLSAVAMGRVGFGLLLIVAFSVGLAAVLITIGLLVVFARRLAARFGRIGAEGPLVRRWLPITSAAVITVSGVIITVQALGG